MKRGALGLLGLCVAGALFAACSSSSGAGGFAGSAGTGAAGAGGTAGGAGSGGLPGGGTGGGLILDSSSDTAAGGGSSCASGPTEDKDQDGFTKQDGDCNDCDPNVNPGAIDVLHTDDGGAWGDEDCDGKPGGTQATGCDDTIGLDDLDPMNAAKAIELCQVATGKKPGVIEAKWVRADGAAHTPGTEVGIQPDFGPNVHVQGGKRMLSISSGYARTPTQTPNCGSNSCDTTGIGVAPTGFPQDTSGCPGDTEINDDVGLELKLRAPTNATGYSFSFRFYSFEYPEWVCTSYNDQFIALVNPAPAGASNGNICFDSKKNPVTVNVGFFDVCTGCPSGDTELLGTGFDTWDDAGATVWLMTQAPVQGGQEFTIRFAIWDTGDQAWDSTALIDNFQWIANGGTIDVGTTPIPVPK
ncbi:MAG: choice-of-anchor L domain-containing protein [Polyangiaceae bacterium]